MTDTTIAVRIDGENGTVILENTGAHASAVGEEGEDYNAEDYIVHRGGDDGDYDDDDDDDDLEDDYYGIGYTLDGTSSTGAVCTSKSYQPRNVQALNVLENKYVLLYIPKISVFCLFKCTKS